MILLLYSVLVLGLGLVFPGPEMNEHSETGSSGSHKDVEGLEHFSYEEKLGEL